jgi:predicted phage terminase large subunit-like protein
MSFDTAQKDKEINNPSVGEVYKRVGATWYLVHVWKDRVRYPELKHRVVAMAGEFQPDAILIEDKSSGASLIQELQQETSLPVIAVEPEADKVTRMDTQTPSLEAGILALPDPFHLQVSWLNAFEENLMHFPSPNEWDEIDALSQFLKFLRKRDMQGGIPVIPFGLTGSSSWKGAA